MTVSKCATPVHDTNKRKNVFSCVLRPLVPYSFIVFLFFCSGSKVSIQVLWIDTGTFFLASRELFFRLIRIHLFLYPKVNWIFFSSFSKETHTILFQIYDGTTYSIWFTAGFKLILKDKLGTLVTVLISRINLYPWFWIAETRNLTTAL